MKIRLKVFLFGEAEKGDYCSPKHCQTLSQLVEAFGEPPKESKGILYAVQALLYDRELIFYRVKEEGFSTEDYMRGLHFLASDTEKKAIDAICMPGVGDSALIDATQSVCQKYKSILIIAENDLYDYLTSRKTG